MGAGVAPSLDPRPHNAAPDPEVPEKAQRRRYTAEYKLRILREADACAGSGQIGVLLRREGLYSSSLTQWRRQRDEGALDGLRARKRGPEAIKSSPLGKQLQKVEKENADLKKQLQQAHTIIEVQKKISEILQIPLGPFPSDVEE